MTTIPARLARTSQSSGSWAVARARSRSLYRDWMRSGPFFCVLVLRTLIECTASEIPVLYAINVPASAIRAKIRQDFERNLLVDDLQTVDILLLKGHQEYQVCFQNFKNNFNFTDFLARKR